MNPFAPEFLLRSLAPASRGIELSNAREAAVLVAILDKPEPSVLLTRRTQTLRSHSGQIALPGGRVDDTDPSHTHAALREAWEEVGLPPADVMPLGQLNPFFTVSRYRITPIVGLAPADFPWQLSIDEVDAVFEVPLAVVLNLNNYHQMQVNRLGQPHSVYFLPWQGWFIWGATAGIFHDLALHMA
ncbi:CoA pyrophosphatase [Gallaecimonas pentaromativorans]|uniref:8-oxo-dGTP pyrophosphatase MutT (NUDIX family) n=1 Tax=Gallaecimonas pentaromativorans TaxID=584787 RepID=A0A3N1PA47_9GAMM|nr:CoA pyrophosphatase [Gallaecimonas pentaromativorans]ROQ24909.1 8-oxo-dGTP pyrophosphatase MutT (NUDIX family) [Gallaecimonas pentaromativorans]